MKLNKEQKAAVSYGSGPLLIIAGAGTGKTTVITERIKHLISSGLATPTEILALTFTEKAASEMEERVDVALPLGYTSMFIGTFHSFCDQVLRASAIHIGLDPGFVLMTQSETVHFLKHHLFDFDLKYFRPLGNPNKFVAGLLTHFSRLADEDINPKAYLRWTKNKKSKEKLELAKWRELSKAYKTYQQLKIKHSKMDFADLITYTIKLFRDRPNILVEYQDKFKYILVDEFQDTNYAQNELVKLLSQKHKNITVVADDDQSIYRFRGAAVSNVLSFRKTYKRAKLVTLTKNYRSKEIILDGAYNLIQNNNPDRLEAVENIDKKLVANRRGKGEIKFIHTTSVAKEASVVADKIEKLIKNGYESRDIAILVRANNHADPFFAELNSRNINCRIRSPEKLFSKPEISTLVAYLKVLVDLDDSVSLYKVLSMDILGIEASVLAALSRSAKKKYISLYEICDDSKNKKIKKVVAMIKEHLKVMRSESAAKIVYEFLEETGLMAKLLDPKEERYQQWAKNIAKFFDHLKRLEFALPENNIAAVVDWIALAEDMRDSPLMQDDERDGEDAVNIVTIHSSKGLEFPVVFVVNLVHLRFPSVNRRDQIPIPEDLIKEGDLPAQAGFHLQEERRLFYVAMTRAKDKLYLTASDFYTDGIRPKKLSPFIFEALGDGVVSAEQKPFSLPRKRPAKKTLKSKPIHIDYLSYTQMATFETCPLHYKMRYILNVPTPTMPAMSFGFSIHSALEKFYKQKLFTKKRLMSALDASWVNEGYSNKKHRDAAFSKAEKYLLNYFKKQFSKSTKTIAIEQPFVVNLKSLKIGGKIDRIDDLGDGVIEIIDYKTGDKVPTQKEVDRNMQLAFYAIAASQVPEFPFQKPLKKIKLSLYYFSEDIKITTTRTAAQVKEAINKIYKVREEIESSDFICSGNYFCRNCEYKQFCNK